MDSLAAVYMWFMGFLHPSFERVPRRCRRFLFSFACFVERFAGRFDYRRGNLIPSIRFVFEVFREEGKAFTRPEITGYWKMSICCQSKVYTRGFILYSILAESPLDGSSLLIAYFVSDDGTVST